MTSSADFICSNCGLSVKADFAMGTKNRNHCPKCLYSLHVDNVPGDRKAGCEGNMEPIGLTFKEEGLDKYGKKVQGELMLIHKCGKCGKVNINRIAGDDNPDEILKIYAASLTDKVSKGAGAPASRRECGAKDNIALKNELKKEEIILLDISAEAEIKKQLLGK